MLNGAAGGEDAYICDHTIDGNVFIPVSLALSGNRTLNLGFVHVCFCCLAGDFGMYAVE